MADPMQSAGHYAIAVSQAKPRSQTSRYWTVFSRVPSLSIFATTTSPDLR